jgi:hypothetical protein
VKESQRAALALSIRQFEIVVDYLFPHDDPGMQLRQLSENVPTSAQHVSSAVAHVPEELHHEATTLVPPAAHAQQVGAQSTGEAHAVPGVDDCHTRPWAAAFCTAPPHVPLSPAAVAISL